MAEHLLPDFKIDKESPTAGIKKLLAIIKPTWNSEKLKIGPLSGGYSSKIFRCHEEHNPEDSVTVRIQHMAETIPEHTNEIELKAIQAVSELGHFPKVFAIFANGYCYQFVKGEPMINLKEQTGSVDEEKLRAIAKEMVAIHSTKLEGVNYTEDLFLIRYERLIRGAPAQKLDVLDAPSRESLLKEGRLVNQYIQQLNSPIVLLHGDSHAGNIVWNKEEGKATFVDWEGANIGYEAREIAYFLATFTILWPIVPKKECRMSFPSKALQAKFIRFYLEASFEYAGKKPSEVTDKEVKDLTDLVHKFSLCPWIIFILMSLSYPGTTAEVSGDAIKFYELSVKIYLDLKEELFGKRAFE